ncbi:hypothetical protein ACFLTD_01470, partial [Elusimicrobiota bacterium]
MKKKLLFFCITLVFIAVSFNLCYCQEEEVQKPQNSAIEKSQEEVDALINEGDGFFGKFLHKESLGKYLMAYDISPDDYRVLWRIARAYERLGYRAGNKEDMESNYTKSMDFAAKAVEANPDDADCHYYAAVASGRMAEFQGGKKLVLHSRAVKEETLN